MVNKLLVVCGFLGLVLLVSLPTIHYVDLPDSIPTHYGFNGIPDNYGNKRAIWILTTVGAAIYIGLHILGKNVSRIKYQHGDLSKKQLAFYHEYIRRSLEMASLLTIGSFLYINYSTIQVAYGNQKGLGPWFLPLLLVFVAGLVLHILINSRKLKDLGR